MVLKRTIVLGNQLFIDLWSIQGFEPVSCEDPHLLPSILRTLLQKDDIACIVVEEKWFDQVTESVRRRLMAMQSPLWVVFPSITVEV